MSERSFIDAIAVHDTLSLFDTLKDLLEEVTLHGEIINFTYSLSSTLIHPQLELAIMAGNLFVLQYVKVNRAWHLQRYTVNAEDLGYTAKDTDFLKRAMDELRRIEGVL